MFSAHDEYVRPSERKRLIENYSQMISEQCRSGKELYLVTFLFNKLPGGQATKTQIMKSEITRVHEQLMARIVRKYGSAPWRHLRPILLGVPDFPVLKKEKTTAKLHQVNNGLHSHALLLVPPTNPLPEGRDQDPLLPKQSRLHTGLDEHFRTHQRKYCNEILYRIDVRRVDQETTADYAFKMTDYTLKSFKWGKVSDSDALILT